MKTRSKMKDMVVLAATSLLTLALSGCLDAGAGDGVGKEAPRLVRPVKAVQLTPVDSMRTLAFPATAKAAREAKLSFRVGGPLVQLDAETGRQVNCGQVIARIDARDFKIAIKNLEARQAASIARLEEATFQHERYTNLFAQNVAAKARYDSARAAFQMAEAQLKADTESLKKAQNALVDTKLIAPFTGYVHQEYVENHESVSVGQPIVSLVDLAALEVELGLPEDLVGRVSQFRTYAVSFDAITGKTFSATLKEVGKKPNPTSRAYPLTLVLETGAGARVRPGMAAEVHIGIAGEERGAWFVVPVQALFNRSREATLVWLFDPDTGLVRQQAVLTRKFVGGGVEITGELTPGQWIVTAGVHHLHAGQKVKLLKNPAATNVGGVL